MPSKFPIGSRVGCEVATGGHAAMMTRTEAAAKVIGYDGLKGVIIQFLEDKGIWHKDQVTIAPAKLLTAREEVKHIAGDAEDGDGPAIGWMELGGLSVALTRASDGALLLSLERAPDYPEGDPVTVRVARSNRQHDVWEGDIE